MDPSEDPRTDPPLAGSETEVLLGFVEWHRHTLLLKTAGLDADQLARTHPPSTMTLGGMLTHLAFVEDYWFGFVFAGRRPSPPWDTADWQADPDADWHLEVPLEERHALLESAVATSREITAQALAAPEGMDALSAQGTVWRPEQRHTLRWILVHMVEEYARHNGHADLLREAVDGSVGE